MSERERDRAPSADLRELQALPAAVATLERLEAERLLAMRHNDCSALEELLAPDMVYAHESGRFYHRDDYIRAIDTHALLYQGDTDLASERALVRNEAMIAFGVMRGHALLDGEQQVFNLRYTATWLRTGGWWQVVLIQKTPIISDARSHAHGAL